MFRVQPVQAETVDFGWAQRIGGINLDYSTALAVDVSGNVFASGFSIDNDSGDHDAFLNKWNAPGSYLWSYGMAGSSDEIAHAVALDGSGNAYVAGAFSGTVDFDGLGSAGTLTSAGLTDIFLLKLKNEGDLSFLWVKAVGGISSDGGYGMTVDASGNVYITGAYADTVDFDPSEGVSNLTSAGYADVFILKLDADGNFLWAKSFGGAGTDNSYDIAVDENGNVFTTGYFNDTVDFDPGAGTSNLTSLGLGDIFISKLDSNGNFVWAKREGGALSDVGVEITLDGSGNAYMTGSFSEAENVNILISKLDQDGNFLWTKSMGGTGFDAGYGIVLDEVGNIYTTGQFEGTADFDPGAGTSNLTSAGASDIFIGKLDNDGNFVWARNLGGTSNDLGEGIVVKNGGLFLTGAFSDTVDFDLGEETHTLTSYAGLDVFVAQLSLTPQIHYVKWNAYGDNNGTSWEHAYRDLRSALSAATNGDEIWVAAGTYKPTSTTDRTISFTLKNGVAIYGGFAGTEAALSQRNVANNLTVLSGDIGLENDNSDNSYHVVVGSDTNNSAILDGFTVTGGNANGDVADSAGGGMYTLTGSPSVSNVIFIDNFAAFGGGMFNSGLESNPPDSDTSGSHPVLTNVIFENNSAVAGGGGMRNMNSSHPILTGVIFKNNTVMETGGGMENFHYSSPILTDVTFDGNTAASGGGMYNWPGNVSPLTDVTFSNNSADFGGGMGNYESSPVLKNVTFTGNSAITRGGGIFNENNSKPTLTDVVLNANTADVGGGMFDLDGSSPILTNVTFSGNSATWYGGGMGNENNSSPTLTNVSFNSNIADSNTKETAAGAMHNRGSSSPSLRNVTFKNNSSNFLGGAMVNELSSSPKLVNVTFSGNVADYGGAIVNRDANSNPTLTHVTVSGNTAYGEGGAIANAGNPTILNSILWGNTGGEIFNLSGTPFVSYSIVQGGHTGTGNLDEDPLLGPLQDNGGFTETMALGQDSPAINAADDTNCPSTDQRGLARPQLGQCDMGAYESARSTIEVSIGPAAPVSYWLAPQESRRVSYVGVNNGPVKITNTDSLSIMAAERVIYKVHGVHTSFSEMMGLPASQLDTIYWLPWYNNVDLDTQLRFANVSDQEANIHVYIGEQEMQGSPFTLAAGASIRKSFPGVNSGPVRIESDQGVPIIAAERVIYKVKGIHTSFSEMMALPHSQLDTTYWLPWYNSVDLDTQLRFANVSDTPATVHIYVGGQEMPGSPFTLSVGESTRRNFAGINSGPVKIESDVNIVAAERVIYKTTGNTPVSFSEMMALPDNQLDTLYWFPWYNNADLDTQLRFANVSASPATVHVYIGEQEMPGSPFVLPVGASTRQSFAGVNNGPVKIESDVPIVAAERVIYKVKNAPTSFSEMMGLPNALLDATFWFPWYNNVDLDTQLRFGIP